MNKEYDKKKIILGIILAVILISVIIVAIVFGSKNNDNNNIGNVSGYEEDEPLVPKDVLEGNFSKSPTILY